MGDLSDLRKASATFAYVHNVGQRPIADQEIKIIGDPVIYADDPLMTDGSWFPTSYRAGIDLICSAPSTSGAGGVLIAAQVSRFIRWRTGFISQKGWTEEYQYIFISVPVLGKIPGPRMALMSITPVALRAIPYVSMAVNTFSKMLQVEDTMATVVKFKNGYYARDIDTLIVKLNQMESTVNSAIRNLMDTTLDQMAKRLDARPPYSAVAVGSRYA